MNERRTASRFTETLSLLLVKVAAVGAFVVLIDIKLTFVIAEQVINIGSGFSADLKGAVIASILISGFAAVKEYWLGSSDQGHIQSAAMSRIAEASAPTAAAAAAAASVVTPVKVEDVKMEVAGDVSIDKGPPK